jgi:hypothetical protein
MFHLTDRPYRTPFFVGATCMVALASTAKGLEIDTLEVCA